MIFTLNDIKMISENKRHSMAKIKGVMRIISTAEYRDYKAYLIDYFRVKKTEPTITGKFRANLIVRTYKDLTNLDKPILDALEKAGVIENDRYLSGFDKHEKVFIKKGQPDSFTIKVYGVKDEV